MYLTPIWEKKKLNVTWHPLSPDYAPAANQYLLFPLISYFRAALVISAVLREIFAFWRSSRRFHAVFVVYAVFVVQRLWRSFTFVYMYLRHDIIKLLRNFVLLLLETVGNIYVFEWISFSKVFFFGADFKTLEEQTNVCAPPDASNATNSSHSKNSLEV